MVWMLLITLLAFFIKGLCGFANSLVFTTLMSFSNSIVHVSPIMLLLNYPSNLIMVWNGRKARLAGQKLGLLGVLSGLVCSFCNTGMLVGTYLSKVTDNTQTFKTNACVVYFLSDCIWFLMFISPGVLNRGILWEALSIFPVAILGLWPGIKSSKIVNDAIAKKIVLAMLIFSSPGLMFNNL